MSAHKNHQTLMVRHSIKGRFVRAHIFRGSERLIGSSRGADVRLFSKDISGVVCIIERRPTGWTVVDLGSQPDVKIDGKPFVEMIISEKCSLQIGEHVLELVPAKAKREIFPLKEFGGSQKLTVMKWRGTVLQTTTDLAESALWKAQAAGKVEVREYQMPAQKAIGKESFAMDAQFKRPLQGTFLTLFIFFAIIFGLPLPKSEVVTKPKDNVYTRMIFDGKVLAQKKKQLVSYGVKSLKGTGNGNGSLSEGTKGVQTQAHKMVNSLRQAGLQSVIGKIAARASQSAKMIAAMAGTPQADASVSGLNGAQPASLIDGKGTVTGNGKGFKVGGIGTSGKGGGTGSYKSGTGLGTGAVGNGEVGLEDTESIIEGGLDREVIAGVIREHLGQIRYCYERQLSASPDLYGKIKVKFSIDADGVVETQSIGQSTLKSAMVEECILRRIATWKFPKPKGGTKVLVSYPFLFKSVN